MRLYIAEKPSLARVIAAGMDTKVENKKTYIKCANGDIIAWAAGHILENKNPEDYNPEHKRWSLEALPHVPGKWGNKEKADREGETYLADLRATIKEYLDKATEVVNAGDAGREGQLIIDELLEFYSYKGKALRLWLENTTPEHVKSRLAIMKSNDEYKGLCEAGKARALADWLFGLNMTRLYTCLAQLNGYHGSPLSIGRVQTPVLGLIVHRDHEIENFISKPFWALDAVIAVKNGDFKANWKPKETQEGLDEEGRVIDLAIINGIADKIKGKTGTITELEKKKKKKSPPLPYSLSSLQIECSKTFDMSPAETLAVVQKLYESGLVTYPRSDCNYIPEDQHREAGKIIEAAEKNFAGLAVAAKGADASLRSGAWNDKKVGEHFAIIPTSKTGKMEDDDEKRVYEKIALRYILQFWPDFEYNETTVKAVVEEEIFAATGREILEKGWQDVSGDPDEEEKQEAAAAEASVRVVFPAMEKGEAAKAETLNVNEKKTTPPSRFTEASIIQAMCGIHRYVGDPAIKKRLKEEDGIGTEATRAEIIKTLFLRNYVEKKGKQVISTEKGRKLIRVLPDILVKPDLTAILEQDIQAISKGEKALDAFAADVAATVKGLVEAVKVDFKEVIFEPERNGGGSNAVKDTGYPCSKCKAPLQSRNGKNGPFWACPNSECKATFNDKNGKPEKPQNCPKCKGAMRKIDGSKGVFWGCQCGFTLSSTADGKPQKTVKCLSCKELLKQIARKDGSGYFWSCTNNDCKATFSDVDGKPVKKDK